MCKVKNMMDRELYQYCRGGQYRPDYAAATNKPQNLRGLPQQRLISHFYCTSITAKDLCISQGLSRETEPVIEAFIVRRWLMQRWWLAPQVGRFSGRRGRSKAETTDMSPLESLNSGKA